MIFRSFLLCLLACSTIQSADHTGVKIGNTKLLFFQDESNATGYKEFIESFSDDFFITMHQPSPDKTSLRNVRLVNSVFGEDRSGIPPKLGDYFGKILQFAVSEFGVDLDPRSYSHLPVLNHDSFGFFSNDLRVWSVFGKGSEQNSLAFDLLFMHDWQMAASTFGGCLLHDKTSGDRFILPMRNSKSQGVFKLSQVGPPSQVELLPWTLFAPIDFSGSCAVGSWKGKFMANEVRGFAPSSALEAADIKWLNISPKEVSVHQRLYPKNRSVYCCDLPKVQLPKNGRIKTVENVTVFEADLESLPSCLEEFAGSLGVSGSLTRALKLIKRDNGFSSIQSLLPEVSKESRILILDRTQLTQGYQSYPLTESLSDLNLPLLRMYHLGNTRIFTCSYEDLEGVYMTPSEEILYRRVDFVDYPEKSLRKRFHCEIDVLIYE